MPELAIFVELTRDGVPLDGFPFAHRQHVEQVEDFRYWKNPAAVYKTLPVEQIVLLQALLLTSSKVVCVRLAGQTDGQIVLQPGGVIVLADCEINDSPQTNAMVLKLLLPSKERTMLEGLGAGSGLDDVRPPVTGAATGGFGE